MPPGEESHRNIHSSTCVVLLVLTGTELLSGGWIDCRARQRRGVTEVR